MKTIASHLYNSSALYSRHSRFIGGLAFSVAALGGAQDAFALPQGAQTVSGQIAVSQPASTQLIVNQSSDKAIINWQSFDILNGESTRFVQPSSGSVALNRITNGNPTQILGQLSANGHLMVVNPNGVFFGPSSHVDVAGLVASTADISNANFLAGHYVFDKPGKPDASIVNKGLITAAEGGLVALVAPGVENDGVISAKLGTVALGAGQTFTLDLYGDNLYSFAVGQKATAKAKDQDGNVLPAAIVNTGTISAEGGTIYMTARAAKEVVDQAINTTGIVEATASREIGGEIVLDGGEGAVSISGTLDVSGKKAGQKGGKIKVTSSKIDLAGSLDASGDAAGGTVLVGYDSRNPGSMTKADSVTVKQGALIDVSSANGTGGYAEVSGNSVALPSGQFFKAAGPQGDGTLVLDPGDFTIGTSGSGNDYWNNIDLANNLNGGNITIDTNGGNATNGNPPNIYVYAPVNWNGSGSLTLSAGHDIDVNANIVSTWSHGSGAQGGITMTADTDGSGGSINIGNANWFSVAGVQVSTVNGNITLTAKGTSSDNVNIGSSAFLGGGKTKVQTGSGTLDIEAGSQINIGSTATFGGDTNVGTVSGNLFLTSNESGSGGDINIFASPISGISHVYSTSGAISLQANGSDLIMNTNAGNLGDASVFSTGSASNIEVYANNVTLTGGATISAGNDLQLNNTGVFSSDTKFVLSGLNVALNQNVGGSIQNAIDAINPSSGTGTVTLGDGT
ncbi:MAG: filamentous hemagglutinin N-terminal domain-containing protein, partial [Alphaproteobacteria bacterium]|nr:filamentous hemagglutinin N-terminal domain-containing protein [Alphaproteobacteria bacterium]